jgi:hypothetical protein
MWILPFLLVQLLKIVTSCIARSQPCTQEYAVRYWAWHCSQAEPHEDIYDGLKTLVGELSSFVWPEGDTLYGHARNLSVVIQWLQVMTVTTM